MARWEPGAQGRLTAAALELFEERGFEQTTAAEIAARAGVTERTFFRHFADKREALFAGGAALEESAVAAVAAADASAAPFAVAGAAVRAAATELPLERLPFARRRQAVIAANPRLQERELLKMASLGAAITGALVQRGVDDAVAAVAAEAAVAGFRVGFVDWIAGPDDQPFPDAVGTALDRLSAVTAS